MAAVVPYFVRFPHELFEARPQVACRFARCGTFGVFDILFDPRMAHSCTSRAREPLQRGDYGVRGVGERLPCRFDLTPRSVGQEC